METRQFDQPVRVALGRNGSMIHVVSNTKQAAEILANRWPAKAAGASSHLAARRACAEALDGRKRAVAARRAFEEAAREAEILVSGTQPRRF